MPKAATWDRYTELSDDPVQRQKDMMNPYFRVGWTKGQDHVEVVTSNPRGKLSFFDVETQKWIEVKDSSVPGWFIQLDRAGVNKIIRDLRKARDDAFGRDE